MSDQLDYRSLNEKVEKKFRQQKTMMRYLFLGISAFMLVLFALLSSTMHNADAAIMLGIGWFTTLTFFGMTTLFDSGLVDQSMKKQLMSQVISQELVERAHEELMHAHEKPKRENFSTQRLSDEYEDMIELGDDGEYPEQKRAPKNQ